LFLDNPISLFSFITDYQAFKLKRTSLNKGIGHFGRTFSPKVSYFLIKRLFTLKIIKGIDGRTEG
jgi:hypothetical protein